MEWGEVQEGYQPSADTANTAPHLHEFNEELTAQYNQNNQLLLQ